MKKVDFIQADVFTNRPFTGNPLAIIPDGSGLTGQEMQAIAREMNLSETTFVLPPTDPKARFQLRIFTPAAEVELCGHATLASAFVLFRLLRPELAEVGFHTRSGRLAVRRRGEELTMDFPADPPAPAEAPPGLLEALGVIDYGRWIMHPAPLPARG